MDYLLGRLLQTQHVTAMCSAHALAPKLAHLLLHLLGHELHIPEMDDGRQPFGNGFVHAAGAQTGGPREMRNGMRACE